MSVRLSDCPTPIIGKCLWRQLLGSEFYFSTGAQLRSLSRLKRHILDAARIADAPYPFALR